MPRIDPESGYGLVTDVCLKKKIRNYVETVKEDAEGYRIYIKEDVPLNRSDNEAYQHLGVTDKTVKDLKRKTRRPMKKIRDFMWKFLRYPDIWGCDDNLCQGSSKLRDRFRAQFS